MDIEQLKALIFIKKERDLLADILRRMQLDHPTVTLSNGLLIINCQHIKLPGFFSKRCKNMRWEGDAGVPDCEVYGLWRDAYGGWIPLDWEKFTNDSIFKGRFLCPTRGYPTALITDIQNDYWTAWNGS